MKTLKSCIRSCKNGGELCRNFWRNGTRQRRFLNPDKFNTISKICSFKKSAVKNRICTTFRIFTYILSKIRIFDNFPKINSLFFKAFTKRPNLCKALVKFYVPNNKKMKLPFSL